MLEYSKAEEKDLQVVLHLCSAHLMHSVAFQINKKINVNKDVRKLFLHSFGFIVRCTDISNKKILFSFMCYVFKSRSINTKAKTNMNTLESFISHEYINLTEVSNNQEEDINNSIATKDSKTFKEKSPFGRHFVSIAKLGENASKVY